MLSADCELFAAKLGALLAPHWPHCNSSSWLMSSGGHKPGNELRRIASEESASEEFISLLVFVFQADRRELLLGSLRPVSG